jgi:hypothetical protein
VCSTSKRPCALSPAPHLPVERRADGPVGATATIRQRPPAGRVHDLAGDTTGPAGKGHARLPRSRVTEWPQVHESITRVTRPPLTVTGEPTLVHGHTRVT